MVESTRLLELNEHDAIARWRDLVKVIRTRILAEHEGRLVNSLGDGLLLDFRDVKSAVAAAFAIQGAGSRSNRGIAPDEQMLLRIGIEVSNVIVGKNDVYGRGVMLGARLMTLAGPGEIVVSAHVRDQLTAGLHADVEDLGECYVKHVETPIRAFRIGPPGSCVSIRPFNSQDDFLPSIAVVPFAGRFIGAEHQVIGEVLAEEIIRGFCRSPNLHVISRLSTTAFRDRDMNLEEISSHLKVNFVLSGTYRVKEDRISLDIELTDVKSARVIWTARRGEQIAGIVSGEQELVEHIVADVSNSILSYELRRARCRALPTLESYAVLMSAITMMHRNSLNEFNESCEFLRALTERATRQAIPWAWMANWYVLRLQQGWSDDPKKDGQSALNCTKKALDADPDCSLALTIDGLVHTHMSKRFDLAEKSYKRAIKSNPSESLAWLLKGTQHAFLGDGEKAVDNTQRALALSPLDPQRYYYDSLAATACLAAHDYERAIVLARRSLRANRTHTSTFRAMAIAQWQLGQEEEARSTVKELLRLEPSLKISSYLARIPAAPFRTGREWASALHKAGVPE